MPDMFTSLITVQTPKNVGTEGTHRIPGVSPTTKEGIWSGRALAPTGAASLLSGLGGYWRLNGDATDSLGVSNGVIQGSGGSWGAGQLGQSFHTGGLARINVGNAAVLKPTTALSVAGWFWFSSTLGSNARIASDWHQSVAQDRWIFISLDGASLDFYLSISDGGYQVKNFGTIGTTIPLDQWVHLAGVWSAGTEISAYRNGDLVDSTGAHAGTTLYAGAGNVCFGLQEETGAGMNGRIDEIGLWSRALTPSEVTYLYNTGSGRTFPF